MIRPAMEIAPIPGNRSLTATRTLRPDSDLSSAFDIDALSKMGDGVASIRIRKAAGAEEEEEDLLDDENAGEQNSSGVSYFA